VASGAGIFNLALWHTTAGTLLYQHDINGALKSYPVTADGIAQRPVSVGAWKGDSVYHGMVVSSNGPDDGIVWEITGNHSREGTPAILHAWNASDLTKELWNSSRRREDRMGSFTKFGNPLVANGRVYVATLSGELAVYGIRYSDGESQVSWLDPRGHSRRPFLEWLAGAL
jgi:outer membrane protein assembly factor BamB